MKLFIRNLQSILFRFKTATLLNILGLAAAFAAFLIILMRVRYEYSFEKLHTHSGRIYRLQANHPSESYWLQARAFADAVFRASPHIEASTVMNVYLPNIYFTAGEGEEQQGYKEKIVSCYPEITRIFSFTMIEGDADCLQESGTVMISETIAKKISTDNAPVIGRQLRFNTELWTVRYHNFVTVGGVYKDFPQNTQLRNGIYIDMENQISVSDWESRSFMAYFLLKENTTIGDAVKQMDQTRGTLSTSYNEDITLGAIPLNDIYFAPFKEDQDIVKTGNKETTCMLVIIAVLVIFIATVNFTNFNTSLAPKRMKSINIQKIMGSKTKILRSILITESIIICFLSFVLSLFIISFITKTHLLDFINIPFVMEEHIPLFIATSFLAIGIGAIAGIYPAFYTTSFSPDIALKGNAGLSAAGKKLRTGLICFQFIISFGLIMGAIFIREQNNYMRYYDLGYDTGQIAIVELNNQLYYHHKDTYRNKLKTNPGIIDVAFADSKLGGSDQYGSWGGNYKENEYIFCHIFVSWNFPSVMDIHILEGEITEIHEKAQEMYFIANKTFRETAGLELTSTIDISFMHSPPKFIAFTEDYNMASLRSEIVPFCMVINPYASKNYSYIKINKGADIQAVIEHTRATLKELDPAFPFEIEFYDSIFNSLYQKEEQTSKMILSFCILSIIISMVGIFGLIIFETHFRFKEIGIRKVHGATVKHILWNFNKHYMKITVVCFLLACPVTTLLVREWLKGFVYKTDMNIWVYLSAFVCVAFLTGLTVTYQSWKAAAKNPVESIKTE